MAYILYDHLISDTKQDIVYNQSGQPVSANIERAYFVDNITDAGSEVQAAASNYIAASVVTPGAAHPNYSYAKATAYRTRPVSSDKAAMVIVSFTFNFSAQPTTYTVEVNGSLEGQVTNAEYDDSGNIIPIMVDYYPDWEDPETNTTPVGTAIKRSALVNVAEPVSQIVIRKSVNSTQAAAIEAAIETYVGKINSATFRSRAVRTVRCDAVTLQEQPYQGVYIATAVFSVRPQTWDEYARITHTQYGTPANIWIAKTGAGAYIANGIRKAKVYPKVDLNALVTLINA